MLVLSDREVKSILTDLSASRCRALLETLSKALSDYSTTRDDPKALVYQPLRQVFTTTLGHTSLFMPASNTETTGIKVVTIPGSGGTPRGAINMFSPAGELIGLLNAEEITAFRTALVSMIPFLRCPIPKTHVVVFGAGKQAEWHIRLSLLLAGDSIQSITIVNRSSSSLDELDKRLDGPIQQNTKLDIGLLAKDRAADYESELKEALQKSDAIMCCTPAIEPHFPSSYLAPSQNSKPKRRFISLIGSYTPSMHEVDSETLLSGGNIYVDSREACLEEAGEIIKARVSGSRLVELGEMLSDLKPNDPEGNIVFKCVGMGIMDVVVSSGLLKIAREMHIGRTIEDF
ncbi:proline utilization protein PrnX [Biscogniauxia marginata]|nr:proline utilization protein PrnX [Biscogniauxia marginata]